MDIASLSQLLQNKVTILNNAKSQAFSVGDLEKINALEQELFETENTLAQLALLVTVNQISIATNTPPAEVMASGLESFQNPSVMIQGPSASAVINGYDVSAYATDASYEQKIQTILSGMIDFSTEADVDAYIQDIAAGSPVTGEMVYAAMNQYGIDLPLLLAIMQNDSMFGTKGIGASTNNPGNIGNTGSATRSFGSWGEGVTAVALWLSQHRVA